MALSAAVEALKSPSRFNRAAAPALFLLACLTAAPAFASDTGPFKVRALAALGYDDNALLNAERKGDAFAQEAVSVSWKNRSARVRARVDYDAFNLNYSEITDQSVVWQSARPGLDFLIDPATAIQADYRFEYAYFHRNDPSTHYVSAGRLGVLRRISRAVRVSAGAGPALRQYTDNPARGADGALRPSDDRSDDRWAADAEIIVDAWRDGVVRAGLDYIRNDSDDAFNDFYDFDVYGAHVSVATRLAAKTVGRFRLGYENLVYDSRPLIDAPAETEDSDVYTVSASVFHELGRQLSLGLSYVYRQKESNEPSQKYSGSLTTLGLYYSF